MQFDLIQNNISIKSYFKICQTIQFNSQLWNHSKITQKYFISVASIYKYSKVYKTYLFAIFGFIDLKLLQIHSNSPFEIWIFYTKSHLNFVRSKIFYMSRAFQIYKNY